MKRYPGVSPFTAEQQNIFFGRDNDIDKLAKLISLRKQVLLYSKSGIGKTSLLNAGVLPQLQDKFLIIKVRFFAYNKENTQTPTQRIVDALKNSFSNFEQHPETILTEIIKNTKIEKTLWYHFKNVELNEKQKFLIVFDQFEELFSYPNEQIEEFKNQFYELTNIDIPDYIMQLIANNSNIEEHKQIDNLYEPLTVKSVFAIRSDRLSLLNGLTDKIQDIQKVFYELNPLDLEQAKQAIINPAKDNNSENFDTSSFNFSNEATNKILNSLTDNEKQSIETTQLQIVCQRIENIAKDKQSRTLKNEAITIEINDLPDFKDIFLNFYEETIEQTEQPTEVRKFIEDQLIRSNQRISLDAIICKDYVNNETLQKLVNTHLLRAERNSTGGFSYELSHDTLIEPIQSVANIRRQKEEQQETENKRLIELNIIKEQQKRQRKITYTISIATIISISFAVFGFVNMIKLKNYLNSTEDAIYKETTEINTLQAYRKFVNNYPYSQFKGDALNKIDSIDDAFYKNALAKDSIPLYVEYLNLFENGKHKADVTEKLEVKPLAEYRNNSNIRTAYFFSNYILGSTTNGQIIEWKYNNDELLEINRYSSKLGKEILAMDVSNNENKIIFGDRNLYLYDIDNDNIIKTLNGHNSQWVISGVCFFDNYQKAVSASYDNQIIIWDLNTGKIDIKTKRGDYKNKIKSININESSNLIAISFYNNDLGGSEYVEILSLKTLELVQKISFGEAVGYTCFSEDDKLLVIAGTKEITLYDINTWGKKQVFSTAYTSGFIRKVIVINNIVIGAGDNSKILFWKFNQKEPFEYIDNESEIYFLDIDNVNKLLLTTDRRSRLRIWEIKKILEGNKRAYH
ncbi:MAG: hypothetical protein JXL97_19930 [Bacteroidales bacterium]|nr:hypothetical protein [Bacteroidales bacterium]